MNPPIPYATDFKLQSVFVIIPALNEEKTILRVINDLKSNGLTEICVVDNGSQDETATTALAAGAQVIREDKRGYGQACWSGMQTIPEFCEWILFCDGDGSDNLSQLSQFWDVTAETDFILGNRRATPEGRAFLTPVQNFGNGLATFLIYIGWGYQYQDLGPLRLIRRADLEQLQMGDRSFGWTVEMQVKAVENGLRIKEIPVNYRRRQGGKSKISGTIMGSFRAGHIILTTLGQLYWQKISKTPFMLWLSSFLLILGTILALPYGNFQERGMIPHFWLGIGIMGLGFIFSWSLSSVTVLWFWGITLITRLLMLGMYPADDIWRYLWEGYIQHFGFSPYEFAPNSAELMPYRTDWWELINTKETSAIYPPLTQLGFWGLTFISPSVWVFKASFVLADLAICWQLSRRWGYTQTLIYAWNPLIIYSFAGGGHYDSWFILPLVLGWLAFEQHQWRKSAFWLGISLAIKWISLPLLAFVFLRSRVSQKALILLLGISPFLITATRFCWDTSCPLIPTSSHFVVSDRSAEFIPYFIGLIWIYSVRNNWIYAILLGIFILVLLNVCVKFIDFIEWYFFGLLTLSPIIHAWYFTWIIPFSVVTRNKGIQGASLSAFIYFVLKHRGTLGIYDWQLTLFERYGLWLPFIVGFLITKLNFLHKLNNKNYND